MTTPITGRAPPSAEGRPHRPGARLGGASRPHRPWEEPPRQRQAVAGSAGESRRRAQPVNFGEAVTAAGSVSAFGTVSRSTTFSTSVGVGVGVSSAPGFSVVVVVMS
jgi:hypothetical protein